MINDQDCWPKVPMTFRMELQESFNLLPMLLYNVSFYQCFDFSFRHPENFNFTHETLLINIFGQESIRKHSCVSMKSSMAIYRLWEKRSTTGVIPQSKLWEKIESSLRGITPSAVRDCSTYKFRCTSFLKFESHNQRREMNKFNDVKIRALFSIKNRAFI